MNRIELNKRRKNKRKLRIRGRIFGASDCPRVSLYKSNRYLYIQAIDDVRGHTVMAFSNAVGAMKQERQNVQNARSFGIHFGGQLQQADIEQVVFDRNGNLYHGIVREVVEGLREAGIVC